MGGSKLAIEALERFSLRLRCFAFGRDILALVIAIGDDLIAFQVVIPAIGCE